MQLPKSQQTPVIVQSVCIAGVCMAAKYFQDVLQLRDLKYCLKESKFRNGVMPFSCKDIYHLQDGQVMLSRSFLHFSHLLFSQQHRKVPEAGSQRTGSVLLSQTALRVGELEPTFINSCSLLAASN